jgi:hypothetical protein
MTAALAVGAAALGATQGPAGKPAAAGSRSTMVTSPSAGTTATATTATTVGPATTTTTSAPPSSAATTTPATLQGPPAAGSGTEVLTYDPYTATGALAPTVVVTERLTATHCYLAGVAPSSYRCFTFASSPPGTGNIYDPCFAAPGRSSGPVVCPIGVPGSRVAELNVSTMSQTTLPRIRRPWAVELSNGQVCTKIDAAWSGLGPYGCQPTPPGPLADCHTPVEATPTWSIACQTKLTPSVPFTTYPVSKVWF